MARLYSSGFELQSLTDFVEWFNSTGTVSIDTTTKRSGAASMRANPSGATGFVNQQFRASGTAAVYSRVYFRIASAPDAETTILSYSDGTVAPNIILQPDLTLDLGYWNGSSQINIASTSAISLNTWYMLELGYDDSNVNNTVSGRLNGSSIGSGNGPNSGSTTLVYIGFVDTCTADGYFDDFAINDSSGTAQTSWPGEGKIVHMQPDSAGDFNECSAGDYTSVDEITPDDATTKATFDADGDRLDVNMETSSNAGIGASDTITLVQVGSRDASVTGTAQFAYVQRIKSQASGTLLESGSITHNDTTYKTAGQGESSLWGYQLTSYVDPQSGGAWTPALLDTAQIGIRATDATPDFNVTTLWALVEYVAAGGGATFFPSRRNMRGIGI